MTEETRMILEKLDGMQVQLDRVETKVDGLETKVDGLEMKVDGLETKVDGLETKVGGLETRIDGLETRVDVLEDGFNNLKFIIENDIQKNIKIIAEGHLDLNRKLDEALKVSQKQELYYLKVNNLEADVRELKKHTGLAV